MNLIFEKFSYLQIRYPWVIKKPNNHGIISIIEHGHHHFWWFIPMSFNGYMYLPQFLTGNLTSNKASLSLNYLQMPKGALKYLYRSRNVIYVRNLLFIMNWSSIDFSGVRASSWRFLGSVYPSKIFIWRYFIPWNDTLTFGCVLREWNPYQGILEVSMYGTIPEFLYNNGPKMD
jgi:hypothetical protein